MFHVQHSTAGLEGRLRRLPFEPLVRPIHSVVSRETRFHILQIAGTEEIVAFHVKHGRTE